RPPRACAFPYTTLFRSIRLEDVAQANPATWFQAYLPGEDDSIMALLERVRAAGYQTLVITVDTAVGANRENNVRAGFTIPMRPRSEEHTSELQSRENLV